MRASPTSESHQPDGLAGPGMVSIPDFVKSLSDSGLLSAQQLQLQLGQIKPQATAQLAKVLVQKNCLTPWQANQLAKGKGVLLGNYVLLERLGAGGMGAVFKAQHRELKRVVALKVLAPALSSSPHAVQRFQREIEAAGKLQHPNVVAAYDADAANGHTFLVMEYVEGADLAALVKNQGPLSVGQAVQFILQAARGLEHAHANGIIHRDIKPSNVLLAANSGTIKIVDLGIARVVSDAPDAAVDGLTKTGNIVGTCDYMAPEQALNSKHADERSDIYSLGCTLYFLLTGRVMYGGETAMEKFIGHRDAAIPSLRQARPDVPKALEQIFRRLVAKSPAERHASMREVIVDLEALTACVKLSAISHPPAPSARPSERRSARRFSSTGRYGLLLAAALLLTVGGIGSWLVLSGSPSALATQAAQRSTAIGETRSAPESASNSEAGARIRSLPAQEQVRHITAMLRQRNPGFDGKVEMEAEQDKVVTLRFSSEHVSDLSPLAALPTLKRLECNGVYQRKSKLSSLAALKGLALTHLSVANTLIADYQPLQGMPLTSLDCSFTPTTDLSSLKGLRLTYLCCAATTITDLNFLQGMPLTALNCDSTRVKDLSPLQKLPLRSLVCGYTGVTDLGPIRGLPLRELTFSQTTEKNLAVVRAMATLEKINNQPAADYWKQHDAKVK